MAKLMQICASNNDLFGLDDEGEVYQYNFSTNAWRKLGQGRSGGAESSPVDGQSTIAHPQSRRGTPRPAA